MEGLSAGEVGVDVAEDELSFSSGIGSDDDLLGTLEAGSDHLELFEGCRVVFEGFLFADLSNDELKGLREDGEFVGLVCPESIVFRQG